MFESRSSKKGGTECILYTCYVLDNLQNEYEVSIMFGLGLGTCDLRCAPRSASWSFPSSLDEADGSDGALPPRRWSFPSAVRRLAELDLDVPPGGAGHVDPQHIFT